jgi:hypothetical protein
MNEIFSVSTFVTLCISTIITALITNYIKWSVDKHFKKQEEVAKLEKAEHEELVERRAQELQSKYKNIVQEVISIEFTPIKEDVEEIKKVQKLAQKATVVNLRINMKNIRDKCIKQRFADTADKASWNELYNDYTEMGGNHFKEYVDQWKEEMEKLPKEKPGTNKQK